MHSQMKLATKLIWGFGLLIALQVGGNITALMLLGHINDDITELATNWLPSICAISDLDHEYQTLRRQEMLHVMSTDDAAMQQYQKKIDEYKANLNAKMAEYEKLISSEEERKIYRGFRNDLDKYLEVHKRLIDLSTKNLNEEAKKLFEGASRETFNAAMTELKKLIALNNKGGADSAKDGNAAYASGRLILLCVLAAATLLGIIVCLTILRGVTRQLGEDPGYLHEVASRIAAGEMNLQFKDHQGDGGVFAVLKQMVGNLKLKIAEADGKSAEAQEAAAKAHEATQAAEAARAAAESAKTEGMLQAADRLSSVVHVVSSASEQLSAQIEQSSQGADHQSRRLSETATAMEEMNATVLEVAKNASQATDTAERAKNKAQEGSSIVGKVVDGITQVQTQSLELKNDMTTLGKQAEGIGHIMNVISDIADQTNLLALNAAIEAARAGEAGRGFAVVADEVRKLAEKTMTATKEVGDAIQQIQQGTRKNIENVDRTVRDIEDATSLAKASGEALQEIVNFVDRSTDQVRSIATASEEQSAASEEINRSVEEVNRIAAETMDALRQSAQAVGELSQQAQELGAMILDMQGGASVSRGGPKSLGGARRPRALT